MVCGRLRGEREFVKESGDMDEEAARLFFGKAERLRAGVVEKPPMIDKRAVEGEQVLQSK